MKIHRLHHGRGSTEHTWEFSHNGKIMRYSCDAHGWIPTSYSLPPVGLYVFVCELHGHRYIDRLIPHFDGELRWEESEFEYVGNVPIGWQPLPPIMQVES